MEWLGGHWGEADEAGPRKKGGQLHGVMSKGGLGDGDRHVGGVQYTGGSNDCCEQLIVRTSALQVPWWKLFPMHLRCLFQSRTWEV